MDSPKPSYTPNYQLYKTPGLTTSQLDMLANSVFGSADAKPIAQVYSAIKLILAFVYIWARAKLVDQQLLIEKQQYETAEASANQSEVNSEASV